MTDGALLDFNPFFDFKRGKVIRLDSNQETVLHFEITIQLKSNRNIRTKEGLAFSKEKYKQWFVVHSKGHDADRKIELPMSQAKTKGIPMTFEMAQQLEKTTTDDTI